jgi:hypothetical protein
MELPGLLRGTRRCRKTAHCSLNAAASRCRRIHPSGCSKTLQIPPWVFSTLLGDALRSADAGNRGPVSRAKYVRTQDVRCTSQRYLTRCRYAPRFVPGRSRLKYPLTKQGRTAPNELIMPSFSREQKRRRLERRLRCLGKWEQRPERRVPCSSVAGCFGPTGLRS